MPERSNSKKPQKLYASGNSAALGSSLESLCGKFGLDLMQLMPFTCREHRLGFLVT